MVVVLAGVEDLLLYGGAILLVVKADGSAHHGRLDELWAGAYDRQYLHLLNSSMIVWYKDGWYPPSTDEKTVLCQSSTTSP